jgi:lysophospholipase L1-like esterase
VDPTALLRAAPRRRGRVGRLDRAGRVGVALLAGVLAGASAQSVLVPARATSQATQATRAASQGAATGASPVDTGTARSALAASPAGGAWVGTWATVPTAVPATNVTTFENQTIREVVHVSIGGDTVRVRLSNEFGGQPLVIGEAHVARRAGAAGGTTAAGSDRRLTFGGRSTVAIPAGAPMLSDPVSLGVPARSDLVVSLYLPQRTPGTTIHAFPFQDNFLAAGNVTGRASLPAASVIGAWYFLSEVAVRARGSDARSVVAFGDSITDGANTTTNANHRWPDFLAQRLQAAPGLGRLGVVNEGIAGNRLLHDPNPPPGSAAENFAAFFGPSALRRFDRDVAAQPGARFVIVLLGVNDLGHPGTNAPASEAVSAADIIGAHRQLIGRAHERGLTIFGATITPFRNDTFGFFSPQHEADRQAINRWIRTGGEFDAVIDFDAALRDPAQPDRLLARYDSGDHLHPNDAGTDAMARAVPLRIFH